jgi:hypothetical protein
MLGLPLAIFVPPPALIRRRASATVIVLFAIAVGMLLTGIVVQILGHWYPGLAVGGGALGALMLMFWAAAPDPRNADEDDAEDGGGGGSPKGPPDDPEHPGGSGLDWDDFDRVRNQWSHERELVAI